MVAELDPLDRREVERRLADRQRLWRAALAGFDLTEMNVLDAGTGEGHCAAFLAALRPGRLTSVTCVAEEIPAAKKRIGESADRIAFLGADLTAMPEIADASFDLIVADFLIAAVSAYRPFREMDVLREMLRVLRPGGRMVITGWDVGESRQSSALSSVFAPTRRRFLELMRLRESLHLLVGSPAFREHPAWWLEARLADCGMPVERRIEIPDIHRHFGWLHRQIGRLIEDLDDAMLRRAFSEVLDRLQIASNKDASLSLGFEFGRIYAIVGCKLEGGILLGA